MLSLRKLSHKALKEYWPGVGIGLVPVPHLLGTEGEMKEGGRKDARLIKTPQGAVTGAGTWQGPGTGPLR